MILMGEKLSKTKQSEKLLLCNSRCVSVQFIQCNTSQDKLIKLSPNHTGKIKAFGLFEEIMSQSQDTVTT